MTNGKEETVDGNVEGLLVGFAEMTYQVGTLYTIVAKEPRGVGFEEYLDVLLFLDSLLHDLSSTQERLSHDHIHLLGETCQIESFLAGRVSTAHNSHSTLTIEETVAGGTCRYTLSLILLLVFKSQVFGCGSCGNNDGVGCKSLTVFVFHTIRTVLEVDVSDASVAHFSSESFSLFTHVHHHLIAVHTIGIARKVFYDGGGGQLSAWLQTGIKYRFQVSTTSIYGSCITSRSTSDNESFDMFHILIEFY